MQKLLCACCGSHLGRHKIPTDGFVEVYCNHKTCKCHTRVENVGGVITSRVVEPREQAFQPLVAVAA